MSGATATKDETILSHAVGHNRGDVALGNNPDLRRESIVNRAGLRYNIYPGELVNRSHPTDNYQFVWCPFADKQWYQDMKDEGYRPVMEVEWIAQRWEWDQSPEQYRRRWSETKLLLQGEDEFLMFRNEDQYLHEQRKRLGEIEGKVDGMYSQGVEDGLREGLSVEGEYAGKQIRVDSGPRRKTVS